MIDRDSRREVTRPARSRLARWNEALEDDAPTASPTAPSASPSGPATTSFMAVWTLRVVNAWYMGVKRAW